MKDLNRWIYAASGVFVLLFAGVIYAWSILSISIGSEFPGWPKAQLSLVFTFVMIFFCLGGLLGGLLSEKISVKINVVASGLLFWAGFWLAAWTQTPWQLHVGFGVMGGLASGLAYNAVLSTMSKWFPDKRGLISGILLMGFGFGSSLIGKAWQVYTPDAPGGWRISFRVLGALLFVVMATSSVFFEKPSIKNSSAEEPSIESVGLPPSWAIRTLPFWMIYCWSVLTGAAGLVLVSQAGGIAMEAAPRTESGVIALVVGLISVFNSIGRVAFGLLYDTKGYRFTMTLDLLLSLFAAVLLIFAIRTGQIFLVAAGFVIGGVAFGGVSTSVSAVTGDFFGMRHYPVNFSIICTNLIFASFGSTAAGYLYDRGNSYLSSMFMLVGMVLLSLVCLWGVRRPKNGSPVPPEVCI
ncbi:MAG: MFS transporter [Synergistaceae bacterium]|nr:MFS transporter [Synergistaceae bacterium]